MIYQIRQGKLKGRLEVIASKSLTHRALIAASLANGQSTIYNPLYAVDTLQTMDILRNLGIDFETRLDNITVIGGNIKSTGTILNAHESGSTLRFLVPVSLLTGEEEHFVCSASLARRPMNIYDTLFKQKGIYFYKKDQHIYCKGPLLPGEYRISGDVSSQFISGILFVLPLLKEDSEIMVTSQFESKSYVEMTIKVLKLFNIDITMKNNIISIPGNQTYLPTVYKIENDFSQAAFFLIASALGSNIEFAGLNRDSIQGDKKILDFLINFGSEIVEKEGILKLSKATQKPVIFDISDTPDLGPILFTLAALSSVPVSIKGIKRLRYKESDRVKAMCDNLDLVGATYELKPNQIDFIPTKLKGGVTVNGFNDHRIVMSMTILGSFIEDGLIIDGVEAIKKSYPTFFEDFRQLGGQLDEFDE